MDQQPNSLPPMELPKPHIEEGEAFNVAATPESVAAAQTERRPQAGPLMPPISPVLPDPTASRSPVPASQPQQPTLPVASPSIADDADLIEKEWVEKAKAIVNQTSHDPRLQNQEMNKFKADYQKKRYNRDLKVSAE